jgi:hypothetical protein
MRRMPRLALAAACALALAGCAGGDRQGPRAAAAPDVPPIGVAANTLGYGPRVGRAQDVVRHAGIGLLREELSWYIVAPRRGVRRWARTDRLMVAAAHRDMKILALLHGTPKWAARGRRGLPTRTAAYGAYVRDVVSRYGPNGSFWRRHPTLPRSSAPRWFELWNEPYYASPVASPRDARRYAALADAGLRAGRAADPDARFLLSADVSYVGDPSVSERWLARIDHAVPDLLSRADGLTAHPYSNTAATSLGELDHLRAAMTRRGLNIPIWVTEVGWSTCSDPRAGCVGEQRQAHRLDAFLQGVARHARSDVATTFVYDMHDLGHAASDREQHFGLLRINNTPKPAWEVVRGFAVRAHETVRGADVAQAGAAGGR